MNANTKLPLPDVSVETAQPIVDIHDRVIEAYYGKLGPHFMRDTQERIHWVCNHVEGTNVLDVGCSQGIVPILLAREGIKVVGIDSSETAIQEAKQHLGSEPGHVRERVKLINADFLSHDFEKFTADTVVMAELLEHVVMPQRFVQAAAYLLPEHGRLIVTVPFGINDFIDHKRTFYLLEPFKLVSKFFDIVEIQMFGKWLGIAADRRSATASVPDSASLSIAQVERLETAFYKLERWLRDDLAKSKKKLEEVSLKYRGATEQITVLRQDVEKEAAKRTEFEQSIKQVQAELAQANLTLSERLSSLQLEIARLSEQEQAQSVATVVARKQIVFLEGELDSARRYLDEANQRYLAALEQSDVLKERLTLETLARKTAEEYVTELNNDLERTKTQLGEERETLRQEIAVRGITEKSLAKLDLELKEANAKLSATVRRLEQTEQMQASRLRAMESRAAAAKKQADKVGATLSFQLGYALIHSFKSWHGIAKLPSALWSIRREAIKRRQLRDSNQIADKVSAPISSTKQKTASKSGQVRLAPSLKRKPLADVLSDLHALRVASVMDEFTFHSFKCECDLHQISPETWHDELQSLVPDLMFIESAWKGKNDLWATKISSASVEIMGVIDWCKKNSIPTVFWNKEDPVHFHGFLQIARAVDYVFTTDIDCIGHYKRELGHDRVYLLPFAAQPASHHPIETFERKDAFNFAGSYYLRYPERQRDFKSIINVVRGLKPTEIYDRNFDKPHPHYEFPDEYRELIIGGLPFDQIEKAYKGYRYGINMNTIKYSQTMFARRVFELLASNTVVVSNYSRGVRLLFGDLVISSDEPMQVRSRLDAICGNDASYRKFRLAGLRKVMSEHTYAHRLAYVVSKLVGKEVRVNEPMVCMVGFPRNQAEAEQMLQIFAGQTHCRRTLCLIGSYQDLASEDDIYCAATIEEAESALRSADFIAAISPQDYYGPNYLKDLALATAYSEAPAIGKAAHFVFRDGSASLQLDGEQYRVVDRLIARASIIRPNLFERLKIRSACDLDEALVIHEGILGIDEFNYCRGSGLCPNRNLLGLVNDEVGLNAGLSCIPDLLSAAEKVTATHVPYSDGNFDLIPSISATDLYAALPTNPSEKVKFCVEADQLLLFSSLASDKHQYLYLTKTFTRQELNLELNSRFQLMTTSDFDLRTVFEFQDINGKKISHSINPAGVAHALAIPNQCAMVRIGLRVLGAGKAKIDRLVLGDRRERPSILLPRSKYLILTKQYPSYDDLYRYGFLHSRVRAYRNGGLMVDVFRLTQGEDISYREFEGVDVVSGDVALLDASLASGAYDHVLVHLMDKNMWSVLKKHIDKVRVTAWVHGAEIQVWQRREYEFERLSIDEITRQKRLSDHRRNFWRELLRSPSPNLELVFVSRYFANEVAQDLAIELSCVKHHIIHNYIDTTLFAYSEKHPDMRKKILSIRPYASRKYANDMTVRAILELSRKPFFQDLEFRLVGDGDLFDETTAPLRGFNNVILEKRFLTHSQIAALHREYGVFLTPTRMDAQGVSRDEAMSSGLVPITTRVAAIPEFVDENCGILVEAEDYVAMVDGIERLYADPRYFARLSRGAAGRVRSQCNLEHTIKREIDIISSNRNQ